MADWTAGLYQGKIVTALVICCCALVLLFPSRSPASAGASDQIKSTASPVEEKPGFAAVLRRFPRIKTIVRAAFDSPVDFGTLLALQDAGLRPVNRDWISIMGRREAIFSVRAVRLEEIERGPLADAVQPLEIFFLHGFYRINFKVVDPEAKGPLKFSVASPRDGFGKKIIQIKERIRPDMPYKIRTDASGNRWVDVACTDTEKGSPVRFDFYFTYLVDVQRLLEHALPMAGRQAALSEDAVSPDGRSPGPASEFLKSSDKIKADAAVIKKIAQQEIGGRADFPVETYWRLHDFTKKEITYDKAKRAAFFSGRKVYRAMEEMYQPATETLRSRVGACPDTSILEAALLRTAGIPARTAGRWGHFYPELYIPKKGWLSPSVTPTGIPLIRDNNHQHLPFVRWSPQVSVRITAWWGQVRIEAME